MEEETKKSSVAAEDQDEKNLDEKIARILEEKLPEILAKTEELKKKKENIEKERIEYVKKIWSYFPGAHTKTLTFEEVKEIAEKLDELAAKVKYTPVLPKEAKTKFWGDKKGRGKRIALIAFLIALLGITLYIKTFIWGW